MVWVPLRRSAPPSEQQAEAKNGRDHPREQEPDGPVTRCTSEKLRQAGAQRGRGLHPKDDEYHTDNEQGNPDSALHPSPLFFAVSIMRKEARRLLRIVAPTIRELRR